MADDLAALHLDVYDSAAGWRSDEHGLVDVPPGWELLPAGSPPLTAAVQAAGAYWSAWLPPGRHRPRRRALGVLAPAANIAAARLAATPPTAVGAPRSARRREDLFDAAVAFLDFAPDHAVLAEAIAREAAERAAALGRGKLSLAERAERSARAVIRHRHTDYEEALDALGDSGFWDDEALYAEAKAAAGAAVDAFLAAHRR